MKYNTDLTLLCVRVPVSQKTEKIAENRRGGRGKTATLRWFWLKFSNIFEFFELAQILSLAKRLHSRLKF
jgi:hypothetical protein